MGISHSTARWLAPLSFAVDFAAQTYGMMISSPSMKEVHDANISFFSPQPFFIAGFFMPQQLFQLVWLYRLCRSPSSTSSSTSSVAKPPGSGTFNSDHPGPDNDENDQDVSTMVDFAPYYALGNFCIATWMIFWNQTALRTSNMFVLINTLAQLYYVSTRLPTMNLSSTNSILTHIVAKTFAGIGVLDLLHNTSVAYFDHQMTPSVLTKTLTGIGFASMALGSDWIFGSCLAYDLVALAVGQRQYGNESWGNLLAMYAGGTAVVVGLRNLIQPPYNGRGASGYSSLPSE
ncbi:hypothetical protein B0H66DRAFT_299308 [Apodospora peruviana]|uniref:Uncharacterized protein n=1 Tax=Apodospora peruviana TaxID=516989 RepID=A0AAE0I107_9PEZI|nr:hypothetical protein B0H66DRAFT_299308 [Apodospora peruviana]